MGQSESREDTRIIVGSGGGGGAGGKRIDLTRRQMGDGKKRHLGRSGGRSVAGTLALN